MIELNGVKFAQNDDEFLNSLFTSSSTCSGYYRVNKRSITIMNQHKTKIGVICNNVLAAATKLGNGEWWYSYGDVPLIGKYQSYSQQYSEIQDITSRFNLPVKH